MHGRKMVPPIFITPFEKSSRRTTPPPPRNDAVIAALHYKTKSLGHNQARQRNHS